MFHGGLIHFKLLGSFPISTLYIDDSVISHDNTLDGFVQSVDTKSLSTFGLYKDQLGTQILKNKYQLRTKNDS